MPEFPGLVVNTHVEIEIGDEVYSSWVEQIDRATIVLAAPISEGQVVEIAPDTPVTVLYNDPSSLYRFETEVRSQAAKPTAQLYLKAPLEVERTQRREFVRWEMRIPVTIAWLEDHPVGQVAEAEPEIWTAQSLDISAGGLLIQSEKRMLPGHQVRIRFDLPDGPIQAEARVVRSYEEEEALLDGVCQLPCRVALSFTRISPRQQDRIVRFIFNEQREMRKKGLL